MIDVDMIKEYIKDKPELNILYDNMEQFGDDLTDVIIPMVYQEAAVLAPSVARVKEKVPDVIILHGVIARLLESESFLELRNQVQYQDNNMSTLPLSAKQEQYTRLSGIMRQYFHDLLTAMATHAFYATAWGSSMSNSAEFDTMYAGYFGFNMFEDLRV